MAVRRIRKISSWTLLILTIISVAILGLFYFGGQDVPLGEKELKNPLYTSELLYWAYILFGLSALSLVGFGLIQFVSSFKANPKSALISFGILIAFGALLVFANSLGDGTPLTTIKEGSDLQAYNTKFWLKVTDMWLYSMYMLLVLVVIALVWGSLKKMLSR